MTMRDKCVEAMCRAIHPDVWRLLEFWGGNREKLDDYHNAELDLSVSRANAAFDAMINTLMEPTKEMVRIGGAMLPIDDLFAPEEAVLCWQAMLSTLSQQEGK